MSPTALATQLGTIIQEAKCEGLSASVMIADELVRIFVVVPPKNCGHIEDYRAAAEIRFETLYGESTNGWHIEADWHVQHPFIACAVPQSLSTALRQVATEQRLTLTTLLPHFIATWNRWHRQLISSSWFGFVHDQHITVGLIDQQRPCGVRTIPLPDNAWTDTQWLADHVNCEALCLNVAAPTSLQLCGDLPPQWASSTIGSLQCLRLDTPTKIRSRSLLQSLRMTSIKPLRTDFAPHSVKRSVLLTQPMTWLVGAIGVLVCAGAAASAFHLIKQTQIYSTDVATIQAKHSAQQKHQSPPKVWAIPDAQAIAITSAIEQLNLPWRDVLDAIESATPANVALLSIEPDARHHVVKGMAEVKTSYEMLAYLEMLKKQEFFGRVVLTKHEINTQDTNKPYRFQFEAQWVQDRQAAK